MLDPESTAKALARVADVLDGPPAPDAPAELVTAVTGLEPHAASFLTASSGGELRSLLTPPLRLLRLKIVLRVAELADGLLRKSGRQPRTGDMNVVIPLLEAASLQEDEDLMQRWAALLANAVDPEGSDVEPGFSDVLRQLSRADAQLFDYIFRTTTSVEHDGTWRLQKPLRIMLFKDGPADNEDAFMVSFENLLRLRLISELPLVRRVADSDGQHSLVYDDAIRCQITAYGVAFALATRRDEETGHRES